LPYLHSDKGTDIGTVLENDDFIRFFNPRKHDWHDHFEVKNGFILSKTSIGAATLKILDFNRLERVLERLELIEADVYP
jgi:hypothetical protein